MTDHTRTRAAVLAALTLLGSALMGCGTRTVNHPPPPPTAVADRLQNNPHVPPALRQQMIDNARSHEHGAQARGQAAQRARAGH